MFRATIHQLRSVSRFVTNSRITEFFLEPFHLFPVLSPTLLFPSLQDIEAYHNYTFAIFQKQVIVPFCLCLKDFMFYLNAFICLFVREISQTF